jgi:hypothetical protein
MDYKVFEARCLELFFKTPDQVTAHVAAYRIGLPVDDARTMLEQMATREVVSMESDDNGVIYFDIPNRPAPSGQPLSWTVPHQQVPHQQPMMMVPVRPVMMMQPMQPMQEKSMAASILLSFFFGPFGMFYSTIPGALVMLFAGGAFDLLTMGIGVLLTWPGCILWSTLATNSHNNKVRHQRNVQHAFLQQQQHAAYMASQRALPTGTRPMGR